MQVLFHLLCGPLSQPILTILCVTSPTQAEVQASILIDQGRCSTKTSGFGKAAFWTTFLGTKNLGSGPALFRRRLWQAAGSHQFRRLKEI
jgi:hypothetical protein